jgi:hypothetical protein
LVHDTALLRIIIPDKVRLLDPPFELPPGSQLPPASVVSLDAALLLLPNLISSTFSFNVKLCPFSPLPTPFHVVMTYGRQIPIGRLCTSGQCCGSGTGTGSVRIRNFWPVPDPIRIQNKHFGSATLSPVPYILNLTAVLGNIPDPKFSIPDPRSKRFWIQDPDPRQRIELFVTQETVSSSRKNYLGYSSLIWIPIFSQSRTTDPGVKRHWIPVLDGNIALHIHTNYPNVSIFKQG